MTKKKITIDEHKELDVRMCRDELVALIQSIPLTANASALKVKVEAIKSLGRFHHALQIDKTVVNANAIAGTFAKQELTMPELKPEHKERLANLLNAQSS